MPAPRRDPVHDRLRVASPSAPGTPIRRCEHCDGVWHDDQTGRDAHRVVFGHAPEGQHS